MTSRPRPPAGVGAGPGGLAAELPPLPAPRCPSPGPRGAGGRRAAGARGAWRANAPARTRGSPGSPSALGRGGAGSRTEGAPGARCMLKSLCKIAGFPAVEIWKSAPTGRPEKGNSHPAKLLTDCTAVPGPRLIVILVCKYPSRPVACCRSWGGGGGGGSGLGRRPGAAARVAGLCPAGPVPEPEPRRRRSRCTFLFQTRGLPRGSAAKRDHIFSLASDGRLWSVRAGKVSGV